MNNEIKEIKIIKSNHSVVIIKNGVIVKEQFAIDDEILDYIINLQKEVRVNNDLIPYFKNREKEFKKRITNLQQENERLKKGYCELKVKCNKGEIDCTNEEYEGMIQANMKGALLLDDYKSRIEKAIPMLKELNIKMKGILNIGIDIKEISDIEDTLNGKE